MTGRDAPYGWLELWTEDPAGRETDRQRQPIDSFVENFLNAGFVAWEATNLTGVTDTGGTDRNLNQGGSNNFQWNWDSGSGDTTHGIQIGSDGTSESITDASLGSQLTANISHGKTTVNTPNTSGSSTTTRVDRTLTNNTGSSFDVNEVGIAAECSADGTTHFFLMLRDTGSPLISVADSESLTVEYQIQISV